MMQNEAKMNQNGNQNPSKINEKSDQIFDAFPIGKKSVENLQKSAKMEARGGKKRFIRVFWGGVGE